LRFEQFAHDRRGDCRRRGPVGLSLPSVFWSRNAQRPALAGRCAGDGRIWVRRPRCHLYRTKLRAR